MHIKIFIKGSFYLPGSKAWQKAELCCVSGQDCEHVTFQHRTRAGICKVPVMQYILNGNTAVPPDSNAVQGIIGDH